VRQQLQRVGGILRSGPVKTRAGNRDLPIPGLSRAALLIRQQQQTADRLAFGRAWQDTGLVFTTRSGRPVQPRNQDITSAWVHWYNTSRLMHRLGRRPPAEAEADYYAHNRDGQPAVHT
jgi:hypothetical protein